MFDLDDYLNQRADAVVGNSSPTPSAIKSVKDKVAEASARKKEMLASISSIANSQDNSFASDIGLNPTGWTGTAVNKAVSAVDTIGDAGAAVYDFARNTHQMMEQNAAGITDAHRDAFAKELMGIATPEDLELLGENTYAIGSGSGEMTARDRIQKGQDVLNHTQKVSDAVNLDHKVAVDNDGYRGRDPLSAIGDVAGGLLKGAVAVPEMAVGIADLFTSGQAGKVLEEAGLNFKEAKAFIDSMQSVRQQLANASVAEAEGFWDTIHTALQNPSAASDAILQSLAPMLAGGVVARGLLAVTARGSKLLGGTGALAESAGAKILASGLGEGTVMAGSAAERFRQQSEDGLLSDTDRNAALAIGGMGALLGAGFGKLSQKAGLADADNLLAGLTNPKQSAAARLGIAPMMAGMEGVEEMAQSSGETMIENVAKGRDLMDGVGNAAAMGLVTGGAMGAGGGVLSAAAAKGAAQQQAEADQAAEAVVATEASKLQAQLDTTTETIANAFKDASDADAYAQASSDALAANADLDAQIKAVDDQIKEAEATRKNLIESYDKALVDRKDDAELVEKIKAARSSVVNSADPEVTKLSATRTQLEEAKAKNTAAMQEGKRVAELFLGSPVQDSAEAVKAAVDEALAPVLGKEVSPQAEVTENAQVAVKPAANRSQAVKKLSLAMEAPGQVDISDLIEGIDSPEFGFTPSEKTVLRSLSKAQVSLNTVKGLEGVHSDVVNGSKDGQFKGLDQYQADVFKSLKGKAPDLEAAGKSLEKLRKFSASHEAKYRAARHAQTTLQEGAVSKVQKLRTTDGKWVDADRAMTDDEVAQNGGMTIHSGSGSYINQIDLERKAIRDTYSLLKNVIAEKTANPETELLQGESKPSKAKTSAEAQADLDKILAGPSKASKAVKAVGKAARQVAEKVVKPKAEQTVPEYEGFNPETDSLVDDVPAVKPEAKAEQPAKVTQPQAEVTKAESAKAEQAQEQTQEVPVVEEIPATGELTVLRESKPVELEDGKLKSFGYNWAHLWLTQKLGNTKARANRDESAGRALVAEHSFFARALGNFDLVKKYLPATHNLTDVELVKTEEALASLAQFSGQLKNTLAANFAKRGTEFANQDPMLYLIDFKDGEPVLDDNLVSAIAVSGIDWLSATLSDRATRDDASINRMLSRDTKTVLNKAERDVLQHFDMTYDRLAQDLGGSVISALGLSLKDRENTPVDVMPRLAASIGGHAIIAMSQMGLIDVHAPTHASLIEAGVRLKQDTGVAEETEQEADVDPFSTMRFVAVKRTKNEKGGMQFDPNVALEMVPFKGTLRAMSLMVGTESRVVLPMTQEPKFSQETTNNSTQLVPTKLAEILAKDVKTPYMLDLEMADVVGNLGVDFVAELHGVVTDLDSVQASRRDSVEAANDAIIRDVEKAQDFMNWIQESEGLSAADVTMYMGREVWNLHRVGMAGNVLNPQASKVARSLVSMRAWETSISPNSAKDAAAIKQFKIAVREALGDSADTALSVDKLVDTFDEWITKPETVEALNAVMDVFDQQEATSERKAIIKAAAGNNGLQGLKALSAAAQYVKAKENGTAFTTTMYREVDGKTNGSILASIQLAAFNNLSDMQSFMQMGGLYTAEQGYMGFPEYRNDSQDGSPSYDLYEKTASTFVAEWLERATNNEQDATTLRLLTSFTGNIFDQSNGDVLKGARNMFKPPVTQVVYGSSAKAAIESMALEFFDSIVKRIEDLNSGNQFDSMEGLKEDLHAIFGKQGAWLDSAHTVTELMEHRFSAKDEKAVVDWFTKNFSGSITKAIDTQFGAFSFARNVVNTAAQAAFAMYDQVYKARQKKMIDGLIASGEIPTYKNGSPEHDLTPTQLAELDAQMADLLPAAHSLFSSESGDPKQGILAAKKGKVTDSPVQDVYKARATKTAGFTQLDLNGKPTTVTDTRTFTHSRGLVSPGVSLLVKLVQSADSAISADAYNKLDALNVHDAHILGIQDALEGATNLNMATFEVMRDFSLLGEVDAMFERVLKAYVGEVMAGTVKGTDYTKVAEETVKLARQDHKGLLTEEDEKVLHSVYTSPLQGLANTLRMLRKRSDAMRMDYLDSVAVVDQYVAHDGTYLPNEVDKAQMVSSRTALEALPNEVKVEHLAAVDSVLLRFTKNGKNAKPAKEKGKDKAKPVEAAWGETGKPSNKPNAVITKFLAANPSTTGTALIGVLEGMFDTKTRASNPDYLILRGIKRALPADVKVQYVTKATPLPASMDGTLAQGSYGLFDMESNTVFIKSAEFVNSNVSMELALHELLHATTSNVIEQVATGQGSSEAKQAVADLESLREELAALPGAESFKPALSNVHELVSWGMTNKPFQDFLAKTDVKAGSIKGKMGAAFIKFVGMVRGLLLGDRGSKNADVEAALSRVIKASAVLMDNAEKAGKVGGSKVLAMAATQSASSTLRDLGKNTAGVSLIRENYLADLLGSHVDPMHGAQGINRLTAPTVVEDVLSSPGITALAMDEQSAFAAAQLFEVIKESLASGEKTVTLSMNELRKVHDNMAKTIQASDFIDPTWVGTEAQNKERAQIIHDEVFGVKDSDYIARFAAMALVYEPLTNLLKTRSAAQEKASTDGSWATRIRQAIESVVGALVAIATRTNPFGSEYDRVRNLSHNLVKIEGAFKQRAQESLTSLMDGADSLMTAALGKAGEGIKSLASSDRVSKSGSGLVKGLSALTKVAAEDRMAQFMSNVQTLRNKVMKEREGFISSAFTEMKGVPAKFLQLLRMTKHNEAHRRNLVEYTAAQLNASFATELTEPQKKALTALLRADAAALLDDGKTTVKDLSDLLSENTARAQEINRLKRAITNIDPSLASMYLHRALALGQFTQDNIARIPLMMLSAESIARMDMTREYGSVPKTTVAQVTPLIDRLVTLHAIDAMSAGTRTALKNLVDAELARTDGGNGMAFTLAMHTQLKNEAKEKAFNGNSSMMHKGYLPEIHNPYTELTAVPQSEGDALVREGWELITDGLPTDATDPTGGLRGLYMIKNRGQLGRTTGMLSMTSKKRKGFSVTQDRFNPLSGYFNEKADAEIEAIYTANIKKSERMAAAGKLDNDNVYLIPVVSESGVAAGFRYEMSAARRDLHLERNNDFSVLLGTLTANTYDKTSSVEQNAEVLKELHDEWKSSHKLNKDDYVFVGLSSREPSVVEDWKLLPETARQEARKLWGMDGMYVHKDKYDLAFGYRKFSAADMFTKKAWDRKSYWNKDKNMRNAFEELTVALFRDVFRLDDKAALRVRQADDIVQALVAMGKDILVIRTGMTWLMNQLSNFSVLGIYGVPVSDMAKNSWIAHRGALSYRKDSEELYRLENEISTGTAANLSATQRRIRQLKDSLERNPARELIEAGMLPTIVEDLGDDANLYGYKSLLETGVSKVRDKVNAKVLDAFDFIAMNKGSTPHNLMNIATQMSDFSSRYALYQHLLTRKKNPLSKDDAMKVISDAFVNYDIPSGRTMQALNDRGIFMFTKYYMRIQQALWSASRNNPGRGAIVAGAAAFAGAPIVFDSAMIFNIGSPFHLGPLELPTYLDEIGTIKGMSTLIQ